MLLSATNRDIQLLLLLRAYTMMKAYFRNGGKSVGFQAALIFKASVINVELVYQN